MKLFEAFVVVLMICEAFAAFMETSLRHYESLKPGATKHVNFDKMRVKKVNKTHHAFFGEIEVFQEFGNIYQVSSLVWKMARNEYKLMPFKLGPDPWCDFLKNHEAIYNNLKAVSDFPAADEVRFSMI